jgi:hypothetical protein
LEVNVYDEAKLKELDDLSNELTRMLDEPEQPGDAARFEAIAAEFEAKRLELEADREAQEKQCVAVRRRERRAATLRMLLYISMLACIVAYFVIRR